ncbi:MAG: hypothetical protein ACI8XB_000616 [Patiriisocius sp.]|jgi:hypothetical protein
MQGNVPLWRLVDIEEFDNWLNDLKLGQERIYDAHVCSAYSASTELKIQAGENLKILSNDLMNLDFSNEFGDIKSSSKLAGEQIIIEVNVTVKKGFVKKEKWDDFVAFDRTLNNLLLLELPLMH